MKLLFTNIRPGRAHGSDRPGRDAAGATRTNASDDVLGRGMDLALTVLVFLVLGWLLDRWLGLFPLFTVSLVVFAAVGAFVRMKFVYDATMERLEAERATARTVGRRTTEDAA